MHHLETWACTPTTRSQTVDGEPGEGSTDEAPGGHSRMSQGTQGGRGPLWDPAETGWCEDRVATGLVWHHGGPGVCTRAGASPDAPAAPPPQAVCLPRQHLRGQNGGTSWQGPLSSPLRAADPALLPDGAAVIQGTQQWGEVLRSCMWEFGPHPLPQTLPAHPQGGPLPLTEALLLGGSSRAGAGEETGC